MLNTKLMNAFLEEELEDIKGAIGICKSKDSQQKKGPKDKQRSRNLKLELHEPH